MDAWIDTYHAVRGLTRDGTFVFLTDSAVGSKEEDNLRHLVINLGSDVPRSTVVPFLTCKHTMDYCVAYADRAQQHGFQSLVVLGGDKNVGQPRCVEHAWQLREAIRGHQPSLSLGGWANPHAGRGGPGQLTCSTPTSRPSPTSPRSSRTTAGRTSSASSPKAERRGLSLPGMFGVFYYRSANAADASGR